MPAVAVIIPTHNRAQLIGATLESVAQQTMGDFEAVVVDDGSECVRDEVSAYGKRFRYLTTPARRSGPAVARNVGIGATRAELICFLDDDDLWHRDKLARQCAIMNGSAIGLCHCDGVMFDSDTNADLCRYSEVARPFVDDITRHLYFGNFICTSSVMLRRDVVMRAGCHDTSPDLRHGEDWLLWLKAATMTSFAYLPEPLFRYRANHASYSNQKAGALASMAAMYANTLAAAAEFAPTTYTPLMRSAQARNRWHMARRAQSSGHIGMALTWRLRAMLLAMTALRTELRLWRPALGL